MSLEFLADPNVWLTLFTLSALEIVLGIDNLVFISIAVSKLPPHQREVARKFGIAVACITRILLLLTLAWLAGLTSDLFTLFGQGISVRDLVLILGGVFLLVKGTKEILELVKGEPDSEDVHTRPAASFAGVIAQIAVIERYGSEIHELAGRAKDMGSAAVFMLMMNVLLCWGLILGPRLS